MAPSLDDLRKRNFVTPREAAEVLGDLDERTVRRAVETGQIPGHKVGTKTLIPAAALLRMIEAAEEPIEAPEPFNATAVRVALASIRAAIDAIERVLIEAEDQAGSEAPGAAVRSITEGGHAA